MARNKILLPFLCITGLIMGCSTNPIYKTISTLPAAPVIQAKSANKDPLTVAIYTHSQRPATPYHIIGYEVISRYNTGGIKRQQAILHDEMRKLAASMGGDAVINTNYTSHRIEGIVVAYEPESTQTSIG